MKDSTLPLHLDAEVAAAERRRISARERKRRQREAQGDCKQINITVPKAVFAELATLAKASRKGSEGFYLRALLRGALFETNSGAGVRFKKTDLPALAAFSDGQ